MTEFVGQDGKTYPIVGIEITPPFVHAGHRWMIYPTDPDWDAAVAALAGEADTARVLARKIREEHYQAVIDQALREACWKLRGEASAEGNVCGPCFECRLEPYYGWAPKETCGGTGKVLIPALPNLQCVRQPCSTCHGTGRADCKGEK